MADFRDQVQESLGSAFTIDRELGGGGMSRVFVARDTSLRRDVVVKVLPPDLVAGVNVERFRREILMAAGLQHPHIVPVLASGEMNGLPWFTMPFVQGESLRQRLARGPLPIAEAVGILREVAKALAYAHERGVVHRDIKPDNVLLTGGTAVVTDFGIAKALSASRTGEIGGTETRGGSLTMVGMSIGTPMYMAPEQAAADPNTDARADLYSFGCLAYELLAGRPPFVGLSPQRLLAAHMGERPQNILDLRRDTPPLLADLVMHCLEKEPAKRPQSAADVVRLLDVTTTSSSGNAQAASSALLGGRVPLRFAIAAWAAVFVASWVLAKAAIVGIGLPSWVLPGALIVAGLGLPVILFTAYVQRTAHRAFTATPTLTPGGSPLAQGTMATIAMKASPHVSWRRTVRGGMLAFGGFIALIAGFMVLRALGIGPAGSLLASGRISAKQPVLIADFAVRKGDSTLAAVVTEALRASLAQSSAITLVSPASLAGALQRMQRPATSRLDLALAREVALREGIKVIVDGDVTQVGTGYAITVRIVTADSAVTLASAQKVVDGPKELIAATDQIGRDLRGKLGESLRTVQNAPALAQVTTPSIQALRLYSEGTRAYDIEGDFAKAIDRLSQAVAIDSGFAMAWRKLGVVYNATGFSIAAGDSALSKAYRFRDRLTRREQLMTTATYFLNGPGADRAKAIAAYDQLLADGDTILAANNIGIAYQSRRQFDKAEQMFRVSEQATHSVYATQNLMSALSLQKRSADEAKFYADQMARFTNPVARASIVLGHFSSLAAVGDVDGAERLADSLGRDGTGAAKAGALATTMAFAAMRGHLAALPKFMAAARAATLEKPTPGAALGDSLMLAMLDATVLEQPERAARRMDATLAAIPLASLPEPGRNYEQIAAVYARAGKIDRAKAILAQRSQMRDTARLRLSSALYHRALGEIAVASNDPGTAIQEFWKGDSLPDGPFDDCVGCTSLLLARAYDRAGKADSAIVHFEKYFADGSFNRFANADWYARGPAYRRTGELYEAKGDRANAAHYYQAFVDLWKTADPELQPQVAEVKKRLARLADTEKR